MIRLLAPLAGVCLLLSSSPVLAQKAPGGAPPATPVVGYEVTTDHFVDRVEAIGTLRANETVTLASTVTETVTAINFEDGQRVHKGDILVEMTSTEEKALIDQQRALVNEASKQLARVKELAASGAAATSVVEQRQREYSAARSGMAALQSRLEDHIIVAPFDGIVGLRNISVGALVQPGTTITTLDDDSVMKLDFAVPSVYLATLEPGIDIVAKASGFKETFMGKVSAINSQINEETRAISVRAILPNEKSMLKPGLLMTVQLLKNPRTAVVIPEEAIIPEGRKAFVLVIDETKQPATVEKREVIIGARRPGDIEILENLKAGEKIVVHGTMTAQAGKPVIVQAIQEKDDKLSDVLEKANIQKEQAKAGNQQEKAAE